jgi:hypothetical protein
MLHFPGVRRVVGICVDDAAARRNLRRALSRADLGSHLLTPAELAGDPVAVAGFLAVVYDLEPMTAASVELVAALRAYQPWMPIVLYPSLREGVLELMLDAGSIPGVSAKEQVLDAEEVDRLYRYLEKVLSAAPASRVAGLVTQLLAGAPDRLLDFARVAVTRLARPDGDRTVSGAAEGLGLTPRTLQRAWPRHELPQPKELLDWLTLLVVSNVASWSGVSLRPVSRILGIEASTFYRLRRRLMPSAPRPRGDQPAHEFDLVLLAFAARCRVSRKRTAAVMEQALG